MLIRILRQVYRMGGAQSSIRTQGVKTHFGFVDRLDSPRYCCLKSENILGGG